MDRIFNLLTDYFNTFTDDPFRPAYNTGWVNILQKLWDNADEPHRRVILDAIANAHVQNQVNSSYIPDVPWAEHDTAPNSTHPALTLTMRALHEQKPLHTITGYDPNLFTPEDLPHLQQAITEQNTWRATAYAHGKRFDPNLNNDQAHIGPINNYSGIVAVRNIAKIMLAPVHLAPIVIQYSNIDLQEEEEEGTLDCPAAALPGLNDLIRQTEITKGARFTARSLALCHCPELVLKVVRYGMFHLTCEEYRTWCDTMENLFPVRELAAREAADDAMYRARPDWLISRALGDDTSIFEDTYNGYRVSIASRLWALEKTRATQK